MANFIILGGLVGLAWISSKISASVAEKVDDLEKRKTELIYWTTQYAAEKLSVDEIKFSHNSIDELLGIVCEYDYLSSPITEDIYKEIYTILIEKKLEEADKIFYSQN